MSTRKSPELTPGLLASNRRNAQKSTGPRTPVGKRRAAQNSFRHGYYATPNAEVREQMVRIGEDPDLLARFERDFTDAWLPEDAMQAAIVADLARLYTKKALIEKMLREARAEEFTQHWAANRNFELTTMSEEMPINQATLAASGYRGVTPCPTAFSEGERLIEALTKRLKHRDWSGDLDAILIPLYGKHPTGMGKSIAGLFKYLAQTTSQSDPGNIERAYAALKLFLTVEYDAVFWQKQSHDSTKRAEFNQSMTAEWTPGTTSWNVLLDQELKIDRQIERKARLLLRLQNGRSAGARRKAREYYDDLDLALQAAEERPEPEGPGESVESLHSPAAENEEEPEWTSEQMGKVEFEN